MSQLPQISQTDQPLALPPRYIAIANPDSLRWQAYEPELRAFWNDKGLSLDLTVVPWQKVISKQGHLDTFTEFDQPAVIRFESPGRDWPVSRLLLHLGSIVKLDTSETDWLNLPYERGRLVRPGLYYAGFRQVLENLHQGFQARRHLRLSACPLQIAEMFDKRAASARLEKSGVPVPPSLAPPDSPESLIDAVQQARFRPAYVKLNTGSSASAIAVLHNSTYPHAVTSIAVRASGLYSTRRLETISGERLHRALRFLLEEGVCIQQGIRMAQIQGENFDVRVVVLHGRPAFTIFRLSMNPMTNLHLGGRRGNPAECRAAIPTRAWLDGLDHCVAAAADFPHCGMVGVDLLFEHGFARSFILEVNAFGDFFPNLTDDSGRSVHRVEIEQTAKRYFDV